MIDHTSVTVSDHSSSKSWYERAMSTVACGRPMESPAAIAAPGANGHDIEVVCHAVV